jgi:tetratricopeptide (TPR) repeat protein
MGVHFFANAVEAERLYFVGTAVGDLSGCEEALRTAVKEFQGMGEQAYLSTQAAYLAQTLYVRGELDEAAQWTDVAQKAGASDDVATVSLIHSLRGKLLAHRGEHQEADREARAAVDLLARTDSLNAQADADVDLATVNRLAGRRDEEAIALREALALYVRKENRMAAARVRDGLREASSGSR